MLQWVLGIAGVVLAAASREVGGTPRLLLLLGSFAACMSLLMTNGARIRERRAQGRPVVESYVDVSVYRTTTIVGLLGLMWLLHWAGATHDEQNALFAGALAGWAGHLVLWHSAQAVALRFPRLVGWPERFPRWWFRGTFLVAALIGATLGLAYFS